MARAKSRTWLLKCLEEIAESNALDVIDFDGEGKIVIKDRAAGRFIESIKTDRSGCVTVKLYSRIDAINAIAKIRGYYGKEEQASDKAVSLEELLSQAGGDEF